MKKLLIIEDDALIGKILQLEISKKSKCEVFRAFDGAEGINMINDHKPDIIITDLAMPKKNGFEVLESLKDYHGKRPYIIVMSNLSSIDDLKRTKELGANEHIIKNSITMSKVIDKINELLK